MAPFEPFEKRSRRRRGRVGRPRFAGARAAGARLGARARRGRSVALIVDHGLRAGSDREAAGDARPAGAASASRPASCAGPARSREAACRPPRGPHATACCPASARRRGILHLLLAHHADDQAETVTMRAARGSGPDGLAGMAALVERPDVRLLRPLLAVPRAQADRDAGGARRAVDRRSVEHRPALRARALARGPLPGDIVAAARRERPPRGRRAAPGPGGGGNAGIRPETAVPSSIGPASAGWAPTCRRGCSAGSFWRSAAAIIRRGATGPSGPPRRLAAPVVRGKSGKGQDFTLSACRLTLRQAPESRRLRWIVWPENGRNGRQPLVPAEFFACGGRAASHVD